MSPIQWPLRWKLTLWTAALVGVVMLLVGFAASWHLYNEGVAELDKELNRVARDFFDVMEHRGKAVNWRSVEEVAALLPYARSTYFVEIVGPGDEPLYRSKNLQDASFPVLSGDRGFQSFRFHNQRVRVGAFNRKGYSLRLAVDMHPVEEVRTDLLRSFLVAAPIVFLLVAFGGWWIARRALAPVEEIAAAAQRITAQRLDQRLPVPPTGDEINLLTRVLNQMIDRLEASFRQATRFTADASHELQTPLTVIRGEIEAALRGNDLSSEQERRLLDLLEETERLTGIVQGLLLLSRADAGRFQLELHPIDITAMLRELVEDAEIMAAPQQLEFEHCLTPGVIVQGNAQFLRQLCLNLLENAVKYNCERGRIRVTCAADREFCVIKIGNTGQAIVPEQASHLFDRFYRGEAARESGRSGHGLGLSICREIARAHAGEISLAEAQPGWTEFCVAIPLHRLETKADEHSSRGGTTERLAPSSYDAADGFAI